MSMLVALSALVGLTAGGGEEPRKKPETPRYEVVVKPNSLVRGLAVTVADLADVQPAGKDAFEIGAVKFGPAPAIGYARTITRTEILQALVAAGRDPAQFVFRGPQESVVQTVATEVPGNEITENAIAVLQAVLAQEGGDVEFDAPAHMRHVQAPPGRRSLEVKARVRDGRTTPTSAVVDVDLMVDGERYKSVPVAFKLTRFQNVLKTAATIRAGTVLGPEVLTLSREKTTQTTGLYLTSLEQVAGQIARRNLQANALLTLADVAPPALLLKGDLVTVVLQQGNVKATVRAVCNQDAALGERVVCTNLQSRAQIVGVATGPGLVVVGGR